MQVFNAYFKIIKKNLPQMFIYLGIFAGLSIAFSQMGVGQTASEFVNSKPDIAVFSQNEDTVLMKDFKELSEQSRDDRSDRQYRRCEAGCAFFPPGDLYHRNSIGIHRKPAE